MEKKLSLLESDPDLASEAHGWNPETFVNVSSFVEWKCLQSHIYTSRIFDRKRGRGCPYCSGKKVLAGFNDLLTTNPEVATEAHGWDPSKVTKGSSKKVKWKCSLGHITEALIKNRVILGNRCSICANQEVLTGFNDLKSQYPQIASESIGWDPSLVVAKSGKRFEWICPLGHLYIQSPIFRISGHGCNICAGKSVLAGFNDLESKYPQIAKEAEGWDPSTVTFGSNAKRKFRCPENHIYIATIKDRTSSKSGCPKCSKHGFNPSDPAWLYFLRHPMWQMLQIGISNHPQQRIASHRLLGWELLEVKGPMDGLWAKSWESGLLSMLKSKGALIGLKTIAGTFDGYTESWIESSYPAAGLNQMIENLHNFESGNG